MFIKFFSKQLAASERAEFHLQYNHLYLENTSPVVGANIQLLISNEIVLELKPSQYINLLDIYNPEETTTQASNVTVFDSAGLGASFQLISYGRTGMKEKGALTL